MKKIYLLLSGCLIVGESMELKNDYTAETREYIVCVMVKLIMPMA